MRGFRRFFSRIQNLMALLIILFFILISILAPTIAPQEDINNPSNYKKVDIKMSYTPIPPGKEALLGTVVTGAIHTQLDVFYSIVWGTRSALRFGLTVALFTALFGVFIGSASGYAGGWMNQLTMRITDAFLAFPVIAGVVFFEQLWLTKVFLSGNPSTTDSPMYRLLSTVDPTTLALICFSWMPYARMVNGMVSHIKASEFVQAARSLGANPFRILIKHLIPNTISPAIVLVARDIGGMVLFQATLTFIGLGSGSDWGELLSLGRHWIMGARGNPLIYWWVFLPGTIVLILFGIGWNLLGDGLNDWLNPRQN
jgi:peptide/nickel transport system permease protein